MGSVAYSGRAVPEGGVSAAVTVTGVTGTVRVESVSGSITVSGSIRFEGDLVGQGELDVQSVSGDVELVLPAKTSADFEVSSFSGDIENELGPPAQKASRFTTEKELEFSTGSGGTRVSVKTLSGGIALRKH